VKIDDLAILEAKAIRYQPGVDGDPIAQLTWEDMCFALGTIEDTAPSLLMRLKYGNEAQAGRTLLRRLKGYAHIVSAQFRLELSPEAVKRLAETALEVSVIPPICPTCGGRKEALIGNLLVVCEPCGGSGLISHKGLADKIGLGNDQWKRAEPAFGKLLSLINRWEDEARAVIAAHHNL
jgi:hypothetical protein